MRKLVWSCAAVACLVACGGGAETITDVDGPFGGVYGLRQLNEAPLPLYFSPAWYPGRGSSPGVQATTMLSADLTIRANGSFTWSTLLEEVALKSGSSLPDYVVSRVRREANGTWTYTESTGAVSLQGIDQFGTYVLAGSATTTGLTLSSTFSGRPNTTFVLER